MPKWGTSEGTIAVGHPPWGRDTQKREDSHACQKQGHPRVTAAPAELMLELRKNTKKQKAAEKNYVGLCAAPNLL